MSLIDLASVSTPMLLHAVVLSAFAGVIVMVVAALHRWYAARETPEAFSLLVGLSVVALSLNTAGTLSQFVGESPDILGQEVILSNSLALSLTVFFSLTGAKIGERVVVDMLEVPEIGVLESDLRTIVRSGGRVTSVTFPDEIKDIEGYDPVDEKVKERLKGLDMVFPRGLTIADLEQRVKERLKSDHGVGYIDIDVSRDGQVEYLALGRRIAGLGPTLPPGEVALTLEADPPYSASLGDRVVVWESSGEGYTRLFSAEIRGLNNDFVTVAVDEREVNKIDPSNRGDLSLVFLPGTKSPEKEFASMLRSAEETLSVLDIDEGSALIGSSIDETEVNIIAVQSNGELNVLPRGDYRIKQGDQLFLVDSPETHRKLGYTDEEYSSRESLPDNKS